jgi:hypothetical protein
MVADWVESEMIHVSCESVSIFQWTAAVLQRLPVDLNQDGFRRAG